MVNVSDSFLKTIKKTMKSKGLNPEDFVISFICKTKNGITNIDIAVIPLYTVEDTKSDLIKKRGCWIMSDTGAFLHLINTRVYLDKNLNIKLKKAPLKGKNSMCWFIGQCLLERMENENLSKKELSQNLKISIRKLNKIFQGNTLDINIKDLINITFEFRGTNKISKYSVMFEKVL